MKKVLVSAYFARNIGDDLFLKILFDRYPNVEWHLLTANRNYKNIFCNYKNVKIIYSYRDVIIGKYKFNLFYKLSDLVQSYRKYDAFVNIGGSIFMQGPAWKMKLYEREYLVKRFKKVNKKAFILGANFGPYNDIEFIKNYSELFTRFDDICFRDNYSISIFEDLSNVRLAPDVVFGLNYQTISKKNKSVGISLIDIENREGLKEYDDKYKEKIIELIERYVKQGYKIKLFSFCENEGDLRTINYVKENITNKELIEVINYEGNIDNFLGVFKTCELIIGTRFHSVILALLFNQPVFPIIYSEKTFNVLKDLNMEDNCCFIKDIDQLNYQKVSELSKKNKLQNREIILESERHFEKLDLLIG